MPDLETTPTSLYCINCTGDVVTGDTIRWTEGVFYGSYRKPQYAGSRTITAVVERDCYGSEKQQHTFTLTILAASGVDALRRGAKILRKGRNIYRNGVWRRAWTDESEREKAKDEKHARGDYARAAREARHEMETF